MGEIIGPGHTYGAFNLKDFDMNALKSMIPAQAASQASVGDYLASAAPLLSPISGDDAQPIGGAGVGYGTPDMPPPATPEPPGFTNGRVSCPSGWYYNTATGTCYGGSQAAGGITAVKDCQGNGPGTCIANYSAQVPITINETTVVNNPPPSRHTPAPYPENPAPIAPPPSRHNPAPAPPPAEGTAPPSQNNPPGCSASHAGWWFNTAESLWYYSHSACKAATGDDSTCVRCSL
jgi:hypothetical protein